MNACTTEGDEQYADLDLRDSPLATRPGPRTTESVEWLSVFEIGGSDADTTLYNPHLLVADDSGVYVYDFGRYQILKVSRAGEIEWVFGGRGQGPDEFTRVRDIELDPRGHLWILDPDNARLTILTPAGEVEARVPLDDMPRADQVIPLSGERAVLQVYERERPLYVIDRTGSIVDRLDVSWPGFRRLHPLASQFLAAADPAGRYFALAFRVGDGFFVYEDLSAMPYHGAFVEHATFPNVRTYEKGRERTWRVDRGTDTAISLAIRSARLYVHFGGETEDGFALIDIYAIRTGAYEKSLILPRSVSAIALADGIVYGLYTNPYPVLQAWRSAGDKGNDTF